MSATRDLTERLIWATRGRSWGFRFLLRGGMSDPLLEYERIFRELADDPLTYGRAGEKVALRFPDPGGRRDTAGRVIPHEFVVSGDLAHHLESAEDGRDQVWPLVEVVYARVWSATTPPADADVLSAFGSASAGARSDESM